MNRPAVALSALLASASAALAVGTPHLILRSGGPVPGMSPPSVFSGNWDYAIISNNNDITFADVAGAPSPDPNIPYLFSVLMSRPADPNQPLRLIAADGIQAPDCPSGTQTFFPRDPRIDDSGRIAFITNFVQNPPVTPYTDGAFYFGTPDNPHLVLRAGDPAPGIPGMNIEHFPGHYALSQSTGKIAFNAFYLVAPEGDVAGQAVWTGDATNPASLHVLAKTGDPVPGMPGSHFDSFATWSVNDAGEVAFSSQLDTLQSDGVEDSVLCVSRADGSLRVIARTGQQVPGMPSGITYWRLADEAFLDNAGHIGFFAFHNDLSRPPYERKAIFFGPIEAPDLLLRVGQQVPGLSPDYDFSDLGGPFMSVSGRVMFRGILRGPDTSLANNFGVFTGTPGNLHMAIRAGDPAPQFPAGVTVYGVSGSFLSSAGRLVVRGQVTGPGIDYIDGNLVPDALWAEDPSGTLQLIARAGIPMEVEPGVMLTPFGFTLAGERSYTPSQARQFFNSSGRLLFAADFLEDGSSALFTVDVTSACRADFDNSGTLAVTDIFAFLNAWFQNDPRADFNGNGLAVSDIFDFLAAWFSGC